MLRLGVIVAESNPLRITYTKKDAKPSFKTLAFTVSQCSLCVSKISCESMDKYL